MLPHLGEGTVMADLGWESLVGEEVSLTVSQGSDMDMSMRWLEDGTPVDLTGWDARAQLRRKPGGDLWLSLTTTPDVHGNVITLTDDGWIHIHIDNTETEQAAWNASSRKEGRWDLEVIAPDGDVKRLVMGPCYTSREVTV